MFSESNDGYTLLECAVKTDDLAAVKLVLQHGGRASSKHPGAPLSVVKDKQTGAPDWGSDGDPGHKQLWDDWAEMAELLSAEAPRAVVVCNRCVDH